MTRCDNSAICIECKAKCCKIGGVFLTKSEKSRIEKQGYTDFCRKDGIFFEMNNKDGVCVFLKNNLCSIYNARPAMCRSFPVYPLKKKIKREYMLINCPLAKVLSKDDIPRLKKNAKKIPLKYANLDISEFPKKIQERHFAIGWPKT